MMGTNVSSYFKCVIKKHGKKFENLRLHTEESFLQCVHLLHN